MLPSMPIHGNAGFSALALASKLIVEQIDGMPLSQLNSQKHHTNRVKKHLTLFQSLRASRPRIRDPVRWVTPRIVNPSLKAQKDWISSPSTVDSEPGVSWPGNQKYSVNMLMFQRQDGSGEQASGMVAQWLLEERDPEDRPVGDFMLR